MSATAIDDIRFVLERFVAVPEDALLRVTLSGGEVFVLSRLLEVEELPIDGTPDSVGKWSGVVVATANLTPEAERLFTIGSGVDFVGSEIKELRDEDTGTILFSLDCSS